MIGLEVEGDGGGAGRQAMTRWRWPEGWDCEFIVWMVLDGLDGLDGWHIC